MDQIQQNGEKTVPKTNKNQDKTKQKDSKQEKIHFETEDQGPAYKYSAEGNAPHTRPKRSLPNHSKKKSCSLYIQTDPLFWIHIEKHEKEPAKIEEEILSLIAQHVKAVNRIYSDTSFDGKYKHNGYQFEVQRIKIHNDTKCPGLKRQKEQLNQPGFLSSLELTASDGEHPFCSRNVDVSNFLNLHSKSNHEEFCLAYVFTYR